MNAPTSPVMVLLEGLRAWWPLMSGVVLFALTIAFLYLRDKFPTRQEFTDLKIAVERQGARADKADAAIEKRVAHLEHQVSELPDKGAFHSLELAIRDLQGSIREVKADLKPVAATSTRLEEFLLDMARPK